MKGALKRLKERLPLLEEQYKKHIEINKVTKEAPYFINKEVINKESNNIERSKKEISTIEDRLSGKVMKVNEKGILVKEQPKERWFIDIFTIHMGYVKNSERRKNKGKSRKKMKKTRTTTFLKSVVSQPGMIQQFKDGKMGISPKSHSFRFRKEEIINY